jgi:hypothetical protein
MIAIYADAATVARLRKLSEELGRSINDLCEAAVAEAALDAFRHRDDDPGRRP